MVAYPDDFRSRSVIDAVQFRVGRPTLTEKHHFANQCRATSTLPVVDCIDFAISNPLSPAATPRRGFAPTVAYHQVALLLAALRIWITLTRATKLFEFPSDHPSSSSHERASPSCTRCISSKVGTSVPNPRSVVTRFATQRITSLAVSFDVDVGCSRTRPCSFPRLRFPRRLRLLPFEIAR